MHLSADYARDSGTTTMCPCELKARYTSICNRAVHSPIRSRGLASVERTGEKAACMFDHEDNLDGQSDKQGHTRTDWVALYGGSSDQKEYPVDWTPHEDVTRQTTKADSLLSTVFWSQK